MAAGPLRRAPPGSATGLGTIGVLGWRGKRKARGAVG